jgi:Spy/CpxP family protein refolding chaperone
MHTAEAAEATDNGFCNGSDLSGVQGLNLTAEQKTKIGDLRTAHLKDIKPIQDKLHSKAGDLRLLWLEKSPTRARSGRRRRKCGRFAINWTTRKAITAGPCTSPSPRNSRSC